MSRPEKKIHIPLDFKEFLADLLKVNPGNKPQVPDDERPNEDAQEEE